MPSMPAVPVLTPWPSTAARGWASATPPRSLPFLVLVGAFAGGVVAITGGGDAQCTPQDPTVCGPELDFSLAMVLLLGSVALQWARPLLACGLGIAFALLEIRYDTPIAGQAFSVYLVLCLVVGAWTLVCRQRQRNLAEAVGGSAQFTPGAPSARHGRWGWWDVLDLFPLNRDSWRALAGFQPGRVVMTVALAVAAAVCVFVYQHAAQAEAVHVARSIRVDARVTDGPDDAQRFTPVANLPGRTGAVEMIPLEPYPLGSLQPILLDPADPDWARLVAEPDDQTYWLTLAGGGLLLALVLASSELAVRRQRLALSGGHHAALSIRVVRIPDGEVLVLPSDRDEVVASYRSSPVDEADLDPSEGKLSPVHPAIVFGDLRHGGWVAAQTGVGLLLPESPLRAERHPLPFTPAQLADPDDELDIDPETVGEEILARRTPTPETLSFTSAGRGWLRAVGAVLMLVPVVLGPYAVWVWTQGITEVWPVIVFGSLALSRGASWWAPGIALTGHHVVTDSGWFRHVLPLAACESVRVDRDEIYLVAVGEAVSFVPFPDVSPGRAQLERVMAMAAELRTLVDRAAGGDTTSRRTAGPGFVAGVLFGLGVVMTAVLRHLV